ncbi:MAG: hypothetical protein QOK05_1546 [Chloroflexota bacterium]|jgi:hypothetical protein|nr:hypothetical protein [Chloroflexota bacterium]
MNGATTVEREATRAGGPWMARHGAVGITLVAVAWAVSWSHIRPWSDFGFFPLWLGYIVTIDALVRARLGRSLLGAGALPVLRVFALSAAMWWIFELFNVRTGNWEYLHASPVSPLRFAIESTIDFSTVLPAVFETTALVHALLPGARDFPMPLPDLPSGLGWASIAVGVACVLLPLVRPHYFFPLIWGALFFLADPVSARRGRPSILAAALAGRWRPILVLALAGIACGFLWEMWNSNSMPRWTYHVPLIPQQRLFEMPLLGYAGYLPFALECFAVYQVASYLWRPHEAEAPEAVSPYIPMG